MIITVRLGLQTQATKNALAAIDVKEGTKYEDEEIAYLLMKLLLHRYDIEIENKSNYAVLWIKKSEFSL